MAVNLATAKLSDLASWRALAIYYIVLAGLLGFQSIRAAEAERYACLTSQGLANTLLFVPCEQRVPPWRAPRAAPALHDRRRASPRSTCRRTALTAARPDRLRAVDLTDVVSSIDTKFRIQIQFFETDNTLRTYNRFAIRQLSGVSYEGESCWISYRFTFLNSADASWKCLQSAFKDFTLA
jgi:hypothetical protein